MTYDHQPQARLRHLQPQGPTLPRLLTSLKHYKASRWALNSELYEFRAF